MKAETSFQWILIISWMAVMVVPIVIAAVYGHVIDWFDPRHYQYDTSLFDNYLIASVVSLLTFKFGQRIVGEYQYRILAGILVLQISLVIAKGIYHFETKHHQELRPLRGLVFMLVSLYVVFPSLWLGYLIYKRNLEQTPDTKRHRSAIGDRAVLGKDYQEVQEPLLTTDPELGVPLNAVEKTIKNKASLGRLTQWAKPEWRLLIVAIIMLVIASACAMAQPLYFGKIIGEVSRDEPSREKLRSYFYTLIGIFAVGGVATSIRGWLFTLIGERIVCRIRLELFDTIVNQDIAFFDQNKTGELMNRLSSDTTAVQSALSVNVSMGLRALGTVVVSLILLFITSWELTLVMMAVIPCLVGIAVVFGRMTKSLTKEYQDALAKAAEVGAEAIGNIRIMRSFSGESLEMGHYKDHVNNSYLRGYAKARAYGIFVGSIMFLANMAIAVVIYYGAILVIKSKLDVAALTSFVLYTIYIAMGLAELSTLFTEMMNAVGASERIFGILDTKPAIPSSGGLRPYPLSGESQIADIGSSIQGLGIKPMTEGRIVFDNVKFTYPTRPDVEVLRGFSLVVEPKTTVALVGASGSGKSTTLCLLERFYDIDSLSGGSISIDGHDIRALDPRWLHRAISIVPQEPVLFSGTIRSNIMYSRLTYNLPPATQAEVEWAGKQANAHDFIMSFPEGYETVVGERGVRLSGGQKQRIAIARALLADPKILLLDEATSALDSESEQLVQDAIVKLMKDRTVIVIAHRLSTVRDANMIVVVGSGVVQASGTHEELMRNSSTYLNLVRRQLQWGDDSRLSDATSTLPLAPDRDDIEVLNQ